MRERVLTKAAEIFERQGFSQTSIQDIADALTLSRSALYYYFTSKEEMLTALIKGDLLRRAEEFAALSTDAGRPAAERLRAVLRAMIITRLTGGAEFRVLDQLVSEMPPKLRRTLNRARREILNVFTGIISEGVAKGEFRQVDPSIAALGLLGIAGWTSWWYSPGGRKSADEVADILVDIGVRGLLARRG